MNSVKTVLLLGAMTGLVMFIGGALGGQQGLVIAFAFAAIFNFGAYWFSDKMILASHGARPVDERQAPELHAIVAGLAQKARMPMPRLYIMDNPAPNAFATGRNPRHAAVCVTTGILQIMNRDELEGVLAHELGHVRNRDILIGTIAATLAGAIMMLARFAQFAAIFGGGGGRDRDEGGGALGMLALAIVAPLGAMLVQMAVSRSREYLADETGARFCGRPESLANALQKIAYASQRVPMQASPATAHMFIMSPLSGGGIRSLFSTHPPIEKRIERLRAMRTPAVR